MQGLSRGPSCGEPPTGLRARGLAALAASQKQRACRRLRGLRGDSRAVERRTDEATATGVALHREPARDPTLRSRAATPHAHPVARVLGRPARIGATCRAGLRSPGRRRACRAAPFPDLRRSCPSLRAGCSSGTSPPDSVPPHRRRRRPGRAGRGSTRYTRSPRLAAGRWIAGTNGWGARRLQSYYYAAPNTAQTIQWATAEGGCDADGGKQHPLPRRVRGDGGKHRARARAPVVDRAQRDDHPRASDEAQNTPRGVAPRRRPPAEVRETNAAQHAECDPDAHPRADNRDRRASWVLRRKRRGTRQGTERPRPRQAA